MPTATEEDHMTASNDSQLRRNLSRMLDAYALSQAAVQRQQHLARGRYAKTFLYTPTGFQDSAVAILGRGTAEQVAATIHCDQLAGYLGCCPCAMDD
jgi:hypothetical protein